MITKDEGINYELSSDILNKSAVEIYHESIFLNPYIPHLPEPKQATFLLLPQQEAFYGGAGGGGKSDALLMGALQYQNLKGYKPLLLRRTYEELDMEDALMDRAKQWLLREELEELGVQPKFKEHKRRFIFPNGNRLNFGFLKAEKDKFRYQGGAYDFIGWDELTGFTETQYTFVSFSRQRKKEGSVIPLRIRGASNPGNEGHDWVYKRFIETYNPLRPFIPAKLIDNPHIDRHAYTNSLMNLDPVTREQILNGDWLISTPGNFFNRDWFNFIDKTPSSNHFIQVIRYWDRAATVPNIKNPDPDWTVGVLMAKGLDFKYYVLDIIRFRGSTYDNKVKIRNTAEQDRRKYPLYTVGIEEEGGSSGKDSKDYYRLEVLPDFSVYSDRPTGSKESRAGPVASQIEEGNVKFLRSSVWNEPMLDECNLFNEGPHDDIVDAMSGAFNYLSRVKGNPYTQSKKRYSR